MNKWLILPIVGLLLASCSQKPDINLDSLPQGEPARVTRYELESVSFYNLEIREENGNEIEEITDSARIDLKELANGNIISIHSFWNEQGYLQYIEGEYEYGINGWIVAVTELGSRKPLLTSTPQGGKYTLHDYTTGFKSFYPQPNTGKVPYYTTQVYADTTKDWARRKNLIEIYSDSSVFQYAGSALAQYEVYYHRSDSFSTDFEEENAVYGSTPTAQWQKFMCKNKNTEPRASIKAGEQLTKTVYFSQAENPASNPLYQLLAPLNFDIMEVPFLHSQEFPKMVTTNQAGGTTISQYNYILDADKRPVQIRELIITPSNEKVPNRTIRFKYKK